MSKKILKINDKLISNDSATYFVADIAANHDGDLSRAVELIYLAAEAGADAAKFQHFTAESIVSDYGFKALNDKISHQSTWQKSVYEVYKDASVDMGWTEELKKACDAAGIAFFTTPYSLDIVEDIDRHVPAYKIGSGDITWIEMIKKIASKNKPYILATGASSLDEVHRAVSACLDINQQFVLMQCNTNYTADLTNFKFINLNVLKTFRSMYPDMVLGLSDHTPGHSTVLGAVALGARMVEKHFTDDTSRIGPDHKFSMCPSTWKEMVQRTRELEFALGSGIKKVEDNEIETVILQRRSLRAVRTLKVGDVISSQDFVLLRPCPSDALKPYELTLALGKTLINEIAEGGYLRCNDFR